MTVSAENNFEHCSVFVSLPSVVLRSMTEATWQPIPSRNDVPGLWKVAFGEDEVLGGLLDSFAQLEPAFHAAGDAGFEYPVMCRFLDQVFRRCTESGRLWGLSPGRVSMEDAQALCFPTGLTVQGEAPGVYTALLTEPIVCILCPNPSAAMNQRWIVSQFVPLHGAQNVPTTLMSSGQKRASAASFFVHTALGYCCVVFALALWSICVRASCRSLGRDLDVATAASCAATGI